MYATSTFGARIKSTATKHVVFNEVYGHFIAEAQIENELPTAYSAITVYDDQFNKLAEGPILTKRMQLGDEGAKYGWHNTYRVVTPSSSTFIYDERWLFFVGGYSRWYTSDSNFNHYGKSIGVIDLDNLDSLSYEKDDPYGLTHTYISQSFIGSLGIPRWHFYGDNLETALIDGKMKIVNAGWVTPAGYVASREGTWIPKIWIHDIEDIIAQAQANPDGPDGLNIFTPEQEIDIFVGDGTMKEYSVEPSTSAIQPYSVSLPQGMGPDSSSLDRFEYDLLPYITASENTILVTDGYTSELYEFSNGSLSSPTVIDKPFPKEEDVKLIVNNGLIGYQHGENYYPDIINSNVYLVYSREPSQSSYENRSENLQYVEPFVLTEPLNYPRAYWPDPLSTNVASGGRRLSGAYETGNLSPWIRQSARKASVSIEYNDNGTYEVVGGGEFSSSHSPLDSGRWLAEGDTASSGGFSDPKTELISVNGVEITYGDRTSTSIHTGDVTYENKDFAPNLKITVNDTRVSVQEIDLSVDPSTPIDVELKFKTVIEGLSRISTSQHEITVNVTLSGVALPNVELDHPSAIINVAAGSLLEWPDDAFTHYALKILKPHVPYENDANGYLPETLTIDANTESVEFFINQGYALNGQQLTFEFGDGWVDDYGDSLGTVVIDLHQSDIVDPNPSGDQFPEIIFNAKLGNITGGQDLSVTVSTFFDGWRQSSYDNYPISTTMTRTIPIQVVNLV